MLPFADVPLALTLTSVVELVCVSRRNSSASPPGNGCSTRSGELDVNSTYRPVGLTPNTCAPPDDPPDIVTEIGASVFAVRSRRYTSWLSHGFGLGAGRNPGTRSSAEDENATYRPSVLAATLSTVPLPRTPLLLWLSTLMSGEPSATPVRSTESVEVTPLLV